MTIRSFEQLVRTVEGGGLHDDATTAIEDAVAAVCDAPGAKATAKVSLTLTITRDGTAIWIEGAITSKPPKTPRERSVFFVGEDGRLTRDNPRQPSMFDTVSKAMDN